MIDLEAINLAVLLGRFVRILCSVHPVSLPQPLRIWALQNTHTHTLHYGELIEWVLTVHFTRFKIIPFNCGECELPNALYKMTKSTLFDVCKLEASCSSKSAFCLHPFAWAASPVGNILPYLLHVCVPPLSQCSPSSSRRLSWLLHDGQCYLSRVAVYRNHCGTLYMDSGNVRVGKDFISAQGPDPVFSKEKTWAQTKSDLRRDTDQTTSNSETFLRPQNSLQPIPVSSTGGQRVDRTVFLEAVGHATSLEECFCCLLFRRGNK